MKLSLVISMVGWDILNELFLLTTGRIYIDNIGNHLKSQSLWPNQVKFILNVQNRNSWSNGVNKSGDVLVKFVFSPPIKLNNLLPEKHVAISFKLFFWNSSFVNFSHIEILSVIINKIGVVLVWFDILNLLLESVNFIISPILVVLLPLVNLHL